MITIGAILSYNNPVMTDRLVENIQKTFSKEFKFIVFDNGSNRDKVSKYTTHSISNNVRMTGGFNYCIDIIEKEYPEYDNIWFFTNDCYFMHSDLCPLVSSEALLEKYPQIGILHPAEDQSVTVCYDVYHDQSINGAKVVTEYDIVCPIFTKEAINSMKNSRFNKKLYQGWGLDHQSSFDVRKSGKLVAINHLCRIGHNTSSTYDKGLDNVHKNRESFYNAAMSEMYQVFNEQFGTQWYSLFKNSYTQQIGDILQYE